MMRARWMSAWPVAAALLLAATTARSAPAPVDKSGLGQVPATSAVVFYLHGVEGTRDRLYVLLENALPDVLPKLKEKLDPILKDGLMGRKLRGLAKNGPIFLAMTEVPKPDGGEPKVAFIVAVTDYKEFRDNILTEEERKNVKDNGAGVESTTVDGKPIYFVNKKEFAVVTPTEEVATAFTKKQVGLDTRMSKAQITKFLKGDMGVYVSLDLFSKTYAEQIKMAKEKVEELLKAGAEFDKTKASAFEAIRAIVGPAFQAVEDSQGLLATFELRPTGLAFHAQTELRPASPTATSLKDLKTTPLTGLGRLPRGQFIYAGMQSGPGLYKVLGPLMLASVGDPDSEAGKATRSALEDFIKANPGEGYTAMSFPLSGITVWNYEDPAKALAAQLKLLKVMPPNPAMKGKPVIKEKAEKYGDYQFASVQMEMDLEKLMEQATKGKDLPEDVQKMIVTGIKAFVGDRMNYWIGTDGKSFLQLTAKDWAAAKRMLDIYTKNTQTLGEVAAFKAIRKDLPAKASFIGLFDVVRFGHTVTGIVKPLIADKVPIPEGFPGALDKTRFSYLGTAAGLTPQRGSFDVFISVEVIKDVHKTFVKPLLNAD